MELRFHLDEHVDPAIARALRNRGIDVTTTHEAGLLNAPDEEHLAFVQREGRVLITHDADFLRHHTAGAEHSGICYCHSQARSISEIIDAVLLLCGCFQADEMKQHVEFI
ncbi:MAG: DUF5615 family PIN-like protein [Planctomycetes bacterium]|nr:DUF5615 family PIN-like protein [Planctomycetota bacterium]